MTEDQIPTVFIIDDDISVRRGISRVLHASGYNVKSFALVKEFLESQEHNDHGCILLDVRMPGLSGLDLQETLGKADYHLPIIFISGHGDVPMTADVMKKGALDFLTKPIDRKHLLEAVQAALVKDRIARKQHTEIKQIAARIEKLTPREFEVMTYVLGGFLNKQIAHELGITEDTVKIHRGHMMSKMEVESVAELVFLANKAGVKAAETECG